MREATSQPLPIPAPSPQSDAFLLQDPLNLALVQLFTCGRGLRGLLYPGESLLFGVSSCNGYYKCVCFEGRLLSGPEVPSSVTTVVTPGY